jgi:hypothetical protein
MKRFKAYDLYRLGFTRALRDLTLDTAEDRILNTIFVNIILLRQFEINPDHVAMKGALKQASFLSDTARFVWKQQQEGKLVQANLDTLGQEVSKFDNLLEYDLSLQQLWAVEKVGIFDTGELIERAEEHLSDSARKGLNERTLQDLRAAGRCLALRLFTASGYHALRALEAVARRYQKNVLGLAVEEDKALGPIINDLRIQLKKEEAKDSSDSPLGLIIANLARMNNIYRKPLTHPEMIIENEGDAREVFNLVTASITMMEKNLFERGVAPPPPFKLPEIMKSI